MTSPRAHRVVALGAWFSNVLICKGNIIPYKEQEREIPPGHQQDMLFPWWDGDEGSLQEVSDRLSKLFHSPRSPGIFDVAGCKDLKFHDLRHEATSRLFERTTLAEAQIMKVTGHKSHRMMMRYANLRGSSLADSLW